MTDTPAEQPRVSTYQHKAHTVAANIEDVMLTLDITMRAVLDLEDHPENPEAYPHRPALHSLLRSALQSADRSLEQAWDLCQQAQQ